MQADLIVIGSAGRTGLSHLLMGGVARRVAQELPCSIITVRSQQPIRLSIERDVPPVDATLCASHRPGRHCERFEHGEELLAHGLVDEAVTHFLACVDEYELCNQAWEWLAKAYARLDQHEKAQWCEARAEEALRRLGNHQIEEELRGEYIPFRRIFGI